jgi:NAD(P)H-nitrite reductase large subunit
VIDPDSLKKAMMVNVRNEVQLIMAALEMTEKDLLKKEHTSEVILNRIDSIRHFYRQTDRLLDLVSRYTTDELIELLEMGGK